MVSNKITEGVGKKIVEALKQQSEIEIQNVVDNPAPAVEEPILDTNNDIEFTNNSGNETLFANDDFDVHEEIQDIDTANSGTFSMPNMMSFNQPSQAPSFIEKESFANDLEGFEIPTNIAVFALIIKQTMEALGISMKSVLQEAQQVQESLNNSARECQTSILEYKKQISVLEKQAQKYQRQYSALNDIISLFIQTSI